MIGLLIAYYIIFAINAGITIYMTRMRQHDWGLMLFSLLLGAIPVVNIVYMGILLYYVSTVLLQPILHKPVFTTTEIE